MQTHFHLAGHPWIFSLVLAAIALLAALLVHGFSTRLLRAWARHRGGETAPHALRHVFRPLALLLPVLALLSVLPLFPFPAVHLKSAAHGLGVALIAAVAWLTVGMLRSTEDFIQHRLRLQAADNLRARRLATQMQIMRQILSVVIIVVATGLTLMTFPAVRQVGTGLFASAGVAGLVVGLAARPTLTSLLAGVQVALTQPIRLEDVVIVEGEWGWIEEIHTTYVVVRIWDLRRLIVPLTYFIEKPFQNWTRTSADLLGSVYLYVDYTVPVDDIRNYLTEVLKTTPLWDGKVANVQMTDATREGVQLRVLVSAADSGKAWDLRCFLREKMIAYVQQNYPQALPRVRAELVNRPPAADFQPGHATRSIGGEASHP